MSKWKGRSGVPSKGRMRGFGLGINGECMCTNPECGHVVKHDRALPCYELKCSKCGSSMIRKG